MDSVTIGIRNGRVLLVNNTIRTAIVLSWRAADAMGTAIAYKARGVIGPEPEAIGAVSVRRDGETIVLINAGQTLLIAPLAAALEIGHGLKTQARRLEELENAPRIALDQAILQRSGAGFGLTNDPTIQAEAGKEAAWNSDLRRYIPGTKLRQSQVGSPQVHRIKEELL